MKQKYPWLYIVFYVVFALFRKVFGLVWFFVVMHFRRYANNVVFNYVLQNNIYLKRLLERPITRPHKWNYYIQPFHNTNGGVIKFRKISYVEYILVYFIIWGWLDADTNNDTFDTGYNNTIINGERLKWMPEFIIKRLHSANFHAESPGNSFDLGDSKKSEFFFWASFLWLIRNTAMNFAYMQRNSTEQYCYKKIGKYEFGWVRHGDLHGVPNYRIRIGNLI